MYIDYNDYVTTYRNGGCGPMDFDRLALEACIKLDNHTTGFDGVKKLRHHFPVDEMDAKRVKMCACKIVHILHQIEQAEKAANKARGYTETENGIRGKVITSVSAGNESISYSVGGGTTATLIDKALADKEVQNKLIRDTVREYLSGVTDARGVNLLYMG